MYIEKDLTMHVCPTQAIPKTISSRLCYFNPIICVDSWHLVSLAFILFDHTNIFIGEFRDWQKACGFIVSEFGGFLCDAGVSCKCGHHYVLWS